MFGEVAVILELTQEIWPFVFQSTVRLVKDY